MGGDAPIDLEGAYRAHSRRVLASLIRLLGDFDAAEEALHDAFVAAGEVWPRTGPPANPYAWLVSAGRFKAIDRRRRRARAEAILPDPTLREALEIGETPQMDPVIPDDELRLIFICCHPALPPDARIALTLREVAGLTTEEIARAYLVPAPTIAQRIVRAKARIKSQALPYETPGPDELPGRLGSVLHVLYLIFNEGYLASAGAEALRADLASEAIRLARLVTGLTGDAEAQGLLALMLLHHARRGGRTDGAGDVILLEDQDRSGWDRAQIREGAALAAGAMKVDAVGPYALQAAIAAVHAEAPRWADTDWDRIVALYDHLAAAEPSPVVALNRAAAIAMRDGADAGLRAVEAVMADGGMDAYPFAHAARADLLRRLGRADEARAVYARALALTQQEPERRFLRRRMEEVGGAR